MGSETEHGSEEREVADHVEEYVRQSARKEIEGGTAKIGLKGSNKAAQAFYMASCSGSMHEPHTPALTGGVLEHSGGFVADQILVKT